jgi:hypothetical protein
MIAKSKTLEIATTLLKDKMSLKFFPIESSFSLPVPIKNQTTTLLTFISFSGGKSEEDRKIKIFQPNGRITIYFPSGKIVHYIDLLALKSNIEKRFDDPIGEFPHEQIKNITLSEYKLRREKLLIKYDRAIELFYAGINDQSFHGDFRKSFFELCEPCIIPYLKKIGPAFFKWLEG